MKNGSFVISLDFELMWGVLDKYSIGQYGQNIINVKIVVPELLKIFNEYNINSTFSIVGFLFFKDIDELKSNIPKKTPNYRNNKLSTYNIIKQNSDFVISEYYFAPDLINKIKEYSNHEIGTHTFSHYYCLEEGQSISEFESDILQAIEIARKNDIKIKSIVFPRNQTNLNYLNICKNVGIICYRGNEKSWLYEAKKDQENNLLHRTLRFLDTYINITGHNCHKIQINNNELPINIPSSRYLRPYMSRLKYLDFLKLKRIKNDMTYAAKNNLTYHLWWHPHNFGKNIDENIFFLRKILNHYRILEKEYHFKSYTMSNLSEIKQNGQL